MNAVLAEYLRAFAGEAQVQARATRSLFALAAASSKTRGRIDTNVFVYLF